MGSSYYYASGAVVGVKSIIRHEKYSSSKGAWDFALLELVEPLNFTEAIKPIALPSADAKVKDGIPVLVSGWGATHNSSESNAQVRAAYVPIVNQSKCKKAYAKFPRQVSSSMICAGLKKGGKDSCQGDSGGPLVEFRSTHPRLVGIVSWGKGCALPKFPGVYARVTSARKWIKSKTGI